MIALIKKIIHRILVLLHLKKEVAAVAAVAVEAKAEVAAVAVEVKAEVADVVAPVVAVEAEVKKDV